MSCVAVCGVYESTAEYAKQAAAAYMTACINSSTVHCECITAR